MKQIATAAVEKDGKYSPAPMSNPSGGEDMLKDWKDITKGATEVIRVQSVSGLGNFTAVYKVDGTLYLVSDKPRIEIEDIDDEDDEEVGITERLNASRQSLASKTQELMSNSINLALGHAIGILDLENNKHLDPFVALVNIEALKPDLYRLDYGTKKELKEEYSRISKKAKKFKSHSIVYVCTIDSSYLVTQIIYDGTHNGWILPYKIQGTKVTFGKVTWGLKGSGIKSWPMPDLLK